MSAETLHDPFRQACRAHQSGDIAVAEAAYRQVIQTQPDHADALHLLALITSQRGMGAEALRLLRRAITIQPRNATFLNNLAEIHRRLNQLDDAVTTYQLAIRYRPAFAEAHFNLANVLKLQGKFEAAIQSYRQAVHFQPNYPKAHFNLANTLREYGWVKASAESYRQALATSPDWPDALMNLANAQADLAETESAIANYRKALSLAPERDELHLSLAGCYLSQGRITEAKDCYAETVRKHPGRWLHQLRVDTLCEIIPYSSASIASYRVALLETLACYADGRGPIDLSTLHSSGAEPPMALAYHGRDDRVIKSAYAEVFEATLPPIQPPAARRGGPLHLGMVVTHGHEGVFFKCLGGILNRLPGVDLRVSLACSRAGANILRQWVKNERVEYLILPDRIDHAADAIRAAGIDHLSYWEVGTDSANYFLPFLRPARVQSATWGWPVTSGIPAMDYFVSADPLEPADGESHYVEKLVRLKSLPTCYARPPLPKELNPRDAFGLSARDHVYLCQQNLRKIQPDFDEILARILSTDTAGVVLLIADTQPRITALLQDRLRRSAHDVVGRIRVLPRMTESQYLNLLSLADVVLDTPGYGGGANTAYDAAACGTPTVTWPGSFHRGRWCAAVNQRLGLDSCIVTSAASYVEIACQIAGDKDHRVALSRKLTESAGDLFDTAIASDELRKFVLESLSSTT